MTTVITDKATAPNGLLAKMQALVRGGATFTLGNPTYVEVEDPAAPLGTKKRKRELVQPTVGGEGTPVTNAHDGKVWFGITFGDMPCRTDTPEDAARLRELLASPIVEKLMDSEALVMRPLGQVGIHLKPAMPVIGELTA